MLSDPRPDSTAGYLTGGIYTGYQESDVPMRVVVGGQEGLPLMLGGAAGG
jgi:hypothetical protein